MLISVKELRDNYNVYPSRILHVGAHIGEEAPEYEKYFSAQIFWIEAQPDLCVSLRRRLNPNFHTIIEACIYDINNIDIKLYITSNSQSTSVLKLGTHARNYPEIKVTSEIIVKTKRLDSIFDSSNVPEFINIDIQGVELRALKSLGACIENIKYIYTEVNSEKVYEECDLITDIDLFLITHGFTRVATRWNWQGGWGDALYVHKSVKKRSPLQVMRGFSRLIIFYKPQIKTFLLAKYKQSLVK